jgi:hypothetical protein
MISDGRAANRSNRCVACDPPRCVVIRLTSLLVSVESKPVLQVPAALQSRRERRASAGHCEVQVEKCPTGLLGRCADFSEEKMAEVHGNRTHREPG